MLKKLCGCTKTCGCADDVTDMPLVCSQSLPACVDPEECGETFSMGCVIYRGDTIANLGITKGMKMTDVLQILILAITNAGCVYPTSPCLSVIGFHSTAIAQTTATFVWNAVVGATNYQIQYRKPSSATWIANPTTTNTTDSIGPLTANTEYYVRVVTNCGANSCNSVTETITTKS